MLERLSPRFTDNHTHDEWMLEILSRLNQVGKALNQGISSDIESISAQFRLIVDNTVVLIPGASAVIFIYDESSQEFDPSSRVSTDEKNGSQPEDLPRPDGLGRRAIQKRKRVISYEESGLEIHPQRVIFGVKSVVCFPLIVAGKAEGVLYISTYEDAVFSQYELLLLDIFVNQATLAIYQARQLSTIHGHLIRKEEELSRLRRAGLLISSRRRLDETLEAILQMALEVTNAHYGIFRLLDRSGSNLITRAIAGDRLMQPLVDVLSVESNSIMGLVARERKAVLIHDLKAVPWAGMYYPLDADLVMCSELAVPLIGASGRLEGVLNLESPETGAFSEADSRLLQALATQAVVAIQEARLLDAVQEIAQLLLTQSFQNVLDRLVEQACDLLNAAASAIWIRNGEDLVSVSASPDHPRCDRVPLYTSLAGQAVISQKAVISMDVRSDPRFHRQDLAQENNWKQALVVSLIASQGDEPVGAFSVYRSESGQGFFTESGWDEKVLTILAHYAALAIQNASHQEALRLIQERNAIAETFAAVGDIAANLLHNLNNKVGIIPVRVQGIQDKCQAALEEDSYLAMSLADIERSAVEAMETVRENLTHLNPIHLAPVNIAVCVQAAVIQANLPEKVQVQMLNLDTLPVISAGERNLVLVFTNLLENAADAMQGEGIVQISGKTAPGWVEINVADNGPGISSEIQVLIFELNYTSRTKTRPGKLGFGLWWVKTVMSRLGGTVSVESDGVHGTIFCLRLPYREAV